MQVDFDQNTCTVNGDTRTWTPVTFQSPYPMALLASNTGGKIAGWIHVLLYFCQVYDDGELILDFVPCQTAAGEVGLYDLVNDVFYANAGTGAFTAGDAVSAGPGVRRRKMASK